MADDYPRHDYPLERAGLDKECKWKLGVKQECPHNVKNYKGSHKTIKDSWLDCVGDTPMIRVNNIT